MKTKKWITFSAVMYGFLILNSCQSNSDGNVMYYEDSTMSSDDYGYYEEPVMDYEKTELEDDYPEENVNTEEYAYLPENEFLSPALNPLSTFSIDVDNASYTNSRRMIEGGQQPSVDAVRTEEFVNYFDYNYPTPKKNETFSVYTEVSECPWNDESKLVHIGLKGYTVEVEDLPPSNLVFLLDISGSMSDENKLPLLQRSLNLLVDKLNKKDRVSIVTYAGEDRVVLESTSCENKEEIKSAINNLESGGSTNGEGGIERAYDLATEYFLEDGNNRVILATDGDFNIGKVSGGDLTRLIEEKRDLGVYLTILGFGMGNYKDAKMESLADQGNGNYFYIDDIRESNRVLVTNLAGTLFTIAKDVKIQVEFNPKFVKEYRLIGYENRLMNAEDFLDDKKDAGELGAGHTVTAIYEIVLGESDKIELKYQDKSSNFSEDLMTIKLRYKKPDQDKSKEIELAVSTKITPWEESSNDFKFSIAVVGFSLILRNSKFIGNFNFDRVIEIAKSSVNIEQMERLEFIRLVQDAKFISE